MKKIKRIGVEKKRIKPTEVRMSSLQQKLNQALSEGPTWDLEMEKFLRRATKKRTRRKNFKA